MADGIVREIESWLAQQSFDPAIDIRFRGANEEQADSMAFVSAAFSLSLAIMFILLVTQFNNFYQSTLILLAVVMSTAGVLLGLLLLSNPFSALLTGVGVVALAGIVVNNNIILIDTFNHVRRQYPELDVRDVIVRATAQRLRPVLLTTVTTVCGLLPLAAGFSVDLAGRSVTIEGRNGHVLGTAVTGNRLRFVFCDSAHSDRDTRLAGVAFRDWRFCAIRSSTFGFSAHAQ